MISGALRRAGFSEYASSVLAARVFSDTLEYNRSPLNKRLWVLIHGFFVDKVNAYRLRKDNYQASNENVKREGIKSLLHHLLHVRYEGRVSTRIT